MAVLPSLPIPLVYRDVLAVGGGGANLTLDDMHIGVQTNNTGGMPAEPNRLPSWLQTVMPRLEYKPLRLTALPKEACAARPFTVDFHRSTREGTYDFGFVDAGRHTGPRRSPTDGTVTGEGVARDGPTRARAGSTVPRHVVAAAYFSQGPERESSTWEAATGRTSGGQSFIEAMFVVFDWDNSRIGFATKPVD
ncbi:hypothetical protein GGR56DRAFT_678458 [Xylariaceae sp. FL0804]|nr:hypothetical protein GGR56DRAFT_678458 [Xylariaceae sp. FL0804]